MTDSAIVTQNGNTTRIWTLSGSSVSNRLILAQVHESGNSGIKIGNITSRINPNRYEFTVTVVGPDAVAFRIAISNI
jgi:hypothetical protein